VRMLFDWLVVGQVVPHNPAAAVRGPKHVVKTAVSQSPSCAAGGRTSGSRGEAVPGAP
jgi:hypothetical protein